MLHYALLFFAVALVAAVLGMRGVAGLSKEVAARTVMKQHKERGHRKGR